MGGDEHYFFVQHEDQPELRRLQSQERTLDWLSIGKLIECGLRPGSQCLELGVGAGSMARWMASITGEEGRVVGVDCDDRFFRLCRDTRVELRRGDFFSVELEAAAYDLVHCRLVLEHLVPQDRRRLLERVRSSLKPGGWLVAADGAFSFRPQPAQTRAEDLFDKLLEVGIEGTAPRADFTLGRQLPRLLEETGFVDVDGLGFFGLAATEGSQHPDVIAESAEMALALGLPRATGLMTDEEVKELISRVRAREVPTSFPYGMAWGRAPVS